MLKSHILSHTILSMLSVFAIATLSGCCDMKAGSFVNTIEALVLEAEVSGDDWDDQQWKLFESELEVLMAGQYEEVSPCLEVTQKKRIENAYAKGKDMLIKENPMDGLINEITEGVESLFE